jgi:pheromone shutdown-related protein TraB
MELTIIGTSHIAQQSVNEIKRAFMENTPDIVAVELDIQRAAALLQDKPKKMGWSGAFEVGFRGFLFAKIGQYVQQKLGKMVGVSPGSEMKMALELARKKKLKVAFIDQPIKVTLQNFSKTLTWREKFRFFGDMVKGIFFPKKQLKELGLENFDLKKVPEKELIVKMMGKLKKRFPSVYKTLVEDRNRYMVKQLVKLQQENSGKRILVIVGAGHEEGMKELLRKIEIVR